jgi:zinc protease
MDVVLNPTFPEEELERQRQIYFGRIQQESVQPFSMAYKKYQEILFGNEHPYSQPSSGSGTEETITAIARADLEAYYKANYVPNNATVVITGDITLDEARTALEQAFGGWQQGTATAVTPPAPQSPTSTQIYLVDKPGAEQSMVMVGSLGMARNNSDYTAFQVMNASLGGQFTSRINMNLREDKGYTYGARSALPSRRGVAPFICYAPVQAEFTKESLYEFVKELNDIVGERPQTDEELQDSKNSLIKRFPQRFQSYSAISGQLSDLVVYDLSLDDWKTYAGRIENVTSGAARGIATNYVPHDALLIVVVGDREKIETGIKELNLGEIH